MFTVDLYEGYINKKADDATYLRIGHLATAFATITAILTAFIASKFENLMDYLQQLFSMFNAPLFATFIVGMLWKRATATAGWIGLVSGTLAALTLNILHWTDLVVTVVVSLATRPKPDSELVGFVYSLTPKEHRADPKSAELAWFRRPVPLAICSAVLVLLLNTIFH